MLSIASWISCEFYFKCDKVIKYVVKEYENNGELKNKTIEI